MVQQETLTKKGVTATPQVKDVLVEGKRDITSEIRKLLLEKKVNEVVKKIEEESVNNVISILRLVFDKDKDVCNRIKTAIMVACMSRVSSVQQAQRLLGRSSSKEDKKLLSVLEDIRKGL